MVKTLSSAERQAIHEAVLKGEQQTTTQLAVVIAPASDEYRSVALTFGLVLGSVFALLLWHIRAITGFPLLLGVQLLPAALSIGVPSLRRFYLRFVPRRTLRYRAGQRAAAEYLHAAHHLSSSMGLLVIYISLAEHYVHIYSSRSVREKIPDKEWDSVVQTLTAAVEAEGLVPAVVKAIGHAAEKLKINFPGQAAESHVATIVELKN